MKKKISLLLFLSGALTLSACGNQESNIAPGEQSEVKNDVVFTQEDKQEAEDIIVKLDEKLATYNGEINYNDFEETNKEIGSALYDFDSLPIPDGENVTVSIANNDSYQTDYDDFVDDPNGCEVEGGYQRDCNHVLNYDTSEKKLGDAEETRLDSLDASILEIPVTVGDKNLLDKEYVFVKSEDGTLMLLSGLGVNVADIKKDSEEVNEFPDVVEKYATWNLQ